MKRTPVLIDVNGVPLRESLSYNGGGAGFGGQMAEWLPPAQSADAALLPALRLGNARADDLVRNNGIAANAVALHKDHIVGHMFLISYRPNWRWLGMRETAAKSFVDEVRRPGQNTQKGCLARSTWKENARLRNLFVKVWAFMRLTAKSLCSRSGIRRARNCFVRVLKP
ncbi:phage portal protein, lambda family [Escherichia coli DEC5B]|nr:phage portal protein, lambda family [Escherichia coli DEC5B]EHV32346.1 phage portal protein, lambda family [Escherichia coli DEC5B]